MKTEDLIIVRDTLLAADRDISEWMQIGRRWRKESPDYSRDPKCPTDHGMRSSVEVRNSLGQAFVTVCRVIEERVKGDAKTKDEVETEEALESLLVSFGYDRDKTRAFLASRTKPEPATLSAFEAAKALREKPGEVELVDEDGWVIRQLANGAYSAEHIAYGTSEFVALRVGERFTLRPIVKEEPKPAGVPNHGPCGYCGEDVLHVHPWMSMGGKPPAFHEECYWKQEKAVAESVASEATKPLSPIEETIAAIGVSNFGYSMEDSRKAVRAAAAKEEPPLSERRPERNDFQESVDFFAKLKDEAELAELPELPESLSEHIAERSGAEKWSEPLYRWHREHDRLLLAEMKRMIEAVVIERDASVPPEKDPLWTRHGVKLRIRLGGES